MDGEKRIFHQDGSSQEKHGDNDNSYRCWFLRNNRFLAEGSSSSAPAHGLAQVYGAPGWKFQPSDFEMVKYFLPRKSSNQKIPYAPIQEANIYYYDPFKLLEEYEEHTVDGRAWYFFTTRERKYPHGERPRRDTGGEGLWKTVGKVDNIFDTDGKTQIGVKHKLNYYECKESDTKLGKGTYHKTGIKMIEYVLETKDNSHAETKRRNEESKDGNKKKRKKSKPHPDGEEQENQKSFHALALCKIYIKGDKTLQEYNLAVPEVEANPEPSFMKMDTAMTDENSQQQINETLHPAVPEVEANAEPSFMKMNTAMTDEILQQDTNEILQESNDDVLGDLESLLPQLLDPIQPPDINQLMGPFGEPSPSFGANDWPIIEQHPSDYFYF